MENDGFHVHANSLRIKNQVMNDEDTVKCVVFYMCFMSV